MIILFMQKFSQYIPPEPKLIELIIKKRKWKGMTSSEIKNFREDYHIVSDKLPILAVADGVTQCLNPGDKYSIPSGAGEVSKIFCETAIEFAEKRYDSFCEKDLVEIFADANKKVGDFNREHNLTAETINYWDIDYYSATAAFALIRDGKLFWADLCDSRVAHLDKNAKPKFVSDDGFEILVKNRPDNWDSLDSKEKLLVHHKLRNQIDRNGQLIGYGVLTGEKHVTKYVKHGVRELVSGDY